MKEEEGEKGGKGQEEVRRGKSISLEATREKTHKANEQERRRA